MIYFLRSIGAAIASVTAEAVVAVSMILFVRKELSVRRMLKEGYNYFIAGTVMTLVLLPISKHLSPSVLHTLLMVVTGVAVYFVVLLIERDTFFLSNAANILNQIKRKNKYQE